MTNKSIGLATVLILSNMVTAVLSQETPEPVELSAASSDAEIVQHLYQHELNQSQTGELSIHFPELSRDRAYAIQRHRLTAHSETDRHVGWKLGWTRIAEAGDLLDPIMGHYMAGRVFPETKPVSTEHFTAGTAMAEPEIVFYMNKDLKGPIVSRAEVVDAIESVGIAMEFVNWRVTEPRTREHAIADNGIAAGVVLGNKRFALENLDFSTIVGQVTVNGEETSVGGANSIMGEDPLAALVWAANELPKWGLYLKAGDFIVSGTVCIPLPVSAGDEAEIEFTGMGSLSATFVP